MIIYDKYSLEYKYYFYVWFVLKAMCESQNKNANKGRIILYQNSTH